MTTHCGFISRDRGYPPDLFMVTDHEFFFFTLWSFLNEVMKKWLTTVKTDNRREILRGLEEVSKQRITNVTHQYFQNL